MLVVESHGLPMGGLVASAQPAEVKLAEATLAMVKVPRAKGRPLRWRGIKPCIPEHQGKRPLPGRKVELSGYRQRWKVERTFAWLGNFRRLVVRYEWLPHCTSSKASPFG
jgi:hypothetical protein